MVFPRGGPCPPQALSHLLNGLSYNEPVLWMNHRGLFPARGLIERPIISGAGHAQGLRRCWLLNCSAAKVCDARSRMLRKEGGLMRIPAHVQASPCSQVIRSVSAGQDEGRAFSIIFNSLHLGHILNCSLRGTFQHPQQNKWTDKGARRATVRTQLNAQLVPSTTLSTFCTLHYLLLAITLRSIFHG